MMEETGKRNWVSWLRLWVLPPFLNLVYSPFILVHSLPHVKGNSAVREDLTLASGADASQIWKWQQVHSATDQNQVLLTAMMDSLIFNIQVREL